MAFKEKKISVSSSKENKPQALSKGNGVHSTELKCRKRCVSKMYQPGTAANRLQIVQERRRKLMAGCVHHDVNYECTLVPSSERDFCKE